MPGYAVGALLAGVTADALGLVAVLWLVSALTFVSGLVAALRMTETSQALRAGPFGYHP
jgi:predicted MFS family arabinose efflux permease